MEVKTEREKILSDLRYMRDTEYELWRREAWIKQNADIIKNKYFNDIEIATEVAKGLGDSQLELKNYFAEEVFNNQIFYLNLAQDGQGHMGKRMAEMGEELKKSEPFLLLMAQTCNNNPSFKRTNTFHRFMEAVDKELLSQPDFANMIVKYAPSSIRFIDENIRKNSKFVAKHISANPKLLTNQYACLAFDVETLREAESLLASKYDMNDELSAQIEFAIETIQAEEKRKQQQEQQEKNQSTTFTGYGRVEPVTPTKHGGRNNPHRPDVHVAMKTHDGRTITRTM